MKRKRTPAHKVNRRQRAAAIAKLAEIVDSDSVAPYVAAKAAAALISAAGRDDDAEDERDESTPGKVLIIPANGREHPDQVYGFPTDESEPRRVVILEPTAEVAAARARHLARLSRNRSDAAVREARLSDIGLLPAPGEAA
ncbi:MAG TPA: hypothetical protein VFE60_28305 [Roseiarcus sp.]|jgi:hypothetical protein|nr:hypothetical protein [Roseiarcus sp.]